MKDELRDLLRRIRALQPITPALTECFLNAEEALEKALVHLNRTIKRRSAAEAYCRGYGLC